MITLNAILRSEGIDPAQVKLVRHQKKSTPGRPTPYQLWKAVNGEYERYQKVQGRPVFDGARYLASFVATPLNETLFVGLYAINGCGTAPAGMLDAITGAEVGGLRFYDLTAASEMADYSGRLIVDWGEGFRAWVQTARKQDKTVIEIRRTFQVPPFPGLLEFRERLSRFAAVPHSWREVLSSVRGVYLLVDPKEGNQYVGSAYGATGFWGRWMEYVSSGHGGNLLMKEVPDADYQVTILEVASSSAGPEEIIRLEGHWKNKLLSRELGLNAN